MLPCKAIISTTFSKVADRIVVAARWPEKSPTAKVGAGCGGVSVGLLGEPGPQCAGTGLKSPTTGGSTLRPQGKMARTKSWSACSCMALIDDIRQRSDLPEQTESCIWRRRRLQYSNERDDGGRTPRQRGWGGVRLNGTDRYDPAEQLRIVNGLIDQGIQRSFFRTRREFDRSVMKTKAQKQALQSSRRL